jgi:hypothetical protein
VIDRVTVDDRVFGVLQDVVDDVAALEVVVGDHEAALAVGGADADLRPAQDKSPALDGDVLGVPGKALGDRITGVVTVGADLNAATNG